MDEVTKQMSQMLSDAYYRKTPIIIEQEEVSSTEESQEVTLQNSDEIVKGFIQDIYKPEVVGNVHINFNDLKYNKAQKKAQWSGSIAGVQWIAVYSGDNEKAGGFYFTADNEKLSKEETLAIHKLNTYFHTVWFSAIRDAILKNELDK
jgi:hypothetical protein